MQFVVLIDIEDGRLLLISIMDYREAKFTSPGEGRANYVSLWKWIFWWFYLKAALKEDVNTSRSSTITITVATQVVVLLFLEGYIVHPVLRQLYDLPKCWPKLSTAAQSYYNCADSARNEDLFLKGIYIYIYIYAQRWRENLPPHGFARDIPMIYPIPVQW